MPEIAIGSGLPRNMRSRRSREPRSSVSARLRSVTSVNVEITQRSPARSTSSPESSTSRTSPPRPRTCSSKLRTAPRARSSASMRARSAGSTSTSSSSSVRPTTSPRVRPKNAHHASFTSTTRLIADAVDQHRVGAGAEDARKELARLAKRALRFHLRGDVAADPAVAAELSRGIEHRLAAGDGVAHAAVGSAADEQEITERPVRLDLAAVRRPLRGFALLERQFPSPLRPIGSNAKAAWKPGESSVKRRSSSCSQYQSTERSVRPRKRPSLRCSRSARLAPLRAQRAEEQGCQGDRGEQRDDRHEPGRHRRRRGRPDPEPRAAEDERRERDVERRHLAQREAHRRPDGQREQHERDEDLGPLARQMAREHDRAREEDTARSAPHDASASATAMRGRRSRAQASTRGVNSSDAERVARPPGDSGADGLLGLEQPACTSAATPIAAAMTGVPNAVGKMMRRTSRIRASCRIEPITRAGRPPEEPSRCDRRKRAADGDHCRPGERHAVCGVGGEHPRRNARRKAQAPEHERGDRDPGRRPERARRSRRPGRRQTPASPRRSTPRRGRGCRRWREGRSWAEGGQGARSK